MRNLLCMLLTISSIGHSVKVSANPGQIAPERNKVTHDARIVHKSPKGRLAKSQWVPSTYKAIDRMKFSSLADRESLATTVDVATGNDDVGIGAPASGNAQDFVDVPAQPEHVPAQIPAQPAQVLAAPPPAPPATATAQVPSQPAQVPAQPAQVLPTPPPATPPATATAQVPSQPAHVPAQVPTQPAQVLATPPAPPLPPPPAQVPAQVPSQPAYVPAQVPAQPAQVLATPPAAPPPPPATAQLPAQPAQVPAPVEVPSQPAHVPAQVPAQPAQVLATPPAPPPPPPATAQVPAQPAQVPASVEVQVPPQPAVEVAPTAPPPTTQKPERQVTPDKDQEKRKEEEEDEEEEATPELRAKTKEEKKKRIEQKRGYNEGDKKEHSNSHCNEVTQCFCMKNKQYNPKARITFGPVGCGWCESTWEGAWGNAQGPIVGACQNWIFKDNLCPRLLCNEHFSEPAFVLRVLLTPTVIAMIYAAFRVLYWLDPDQKAEDSPDESKITTFKRTIEDFKKGGGGSRKKQDFATAIPYQRDPPMKTAAQAFGTFCRSPIIQSVLFSVMKYGLFCCFCLTAFRVSGHAMATTNFELVMKVVNGFADLCRSTVAVTGFLFSFYLLDRVAAFYSILRTGWNIEGAVNGIAMHVGGGVLDAKVPADQLEQFKWDVYRYLMLTTYIVFREMSPQLAQVTDENMVEIGFLKPEEMLVLKVTNGSPRHVVICWLEKLMVKSSEQIMDTGVLINIYKRIDELRGWCATVSAEAMIRAPWSFQAFVFSAVQVQVILFPFSILVDVKSREDLINLEILSTTLTCLVIFAFYNSMVALLEAFKDPFGFSVDQLNAEFVFLETEGIVIDFLTTPSKENILEAAQERNPILAQSPGLENIHESESLHQ